MARIDIDQGDALRAEIVFCPQGIVVPPPADVPNGPVQKSGVFDCDGQFVKASHTCRPHGYFNDIPDYPSSDDIIEMSGAWMFAGPLFGHFGHFLMDSLARSWAYGELKGKIEGIVFTPKQNRGNIEHVLNVQTPLLRAVGIDCPIHIVTRPTRIEELHVPYQGIGIGSGWELGTEAFRTYMRSHSDLGVAPSGPEKIYLSRSALPKNRASFLAETILEQHLIAAGFDIIHPQKLSKDDQIARYRAAKMIISPDGSPLHLLAYVGNENQNVAVIARRSAATQSIFANQIKEFTGAQAITIDCLKHDWLPDNARRPGRTSWGEFDMPQLFDSLMDAGFLPKDTPRWDAVSDEVLKQELAQISEVEGRTYTRYQPPVAP